uniref:Photosystem II reaction center protein J n=1 Tax=Agarophyton chilense TaxID=2510777 RepID=A0A141SEP2_AGACH|nr:photosystem II protein J [Agarophyton chilense]AMK96760.1 photosystem II protein J [Agarophyton chilense]ASP44655.1 photosystem II protein J [Agarophyton chilense]UAD84311.1 photosystem II protein J [Agarophyton chilense]
MAGTGRVPLWLVATVGGIAVLTVLGIFIYGSYSGIGSSL